MVQLLLIDDDADIAFLVRRLCRSAGHDVQHASSLAAAEESLARERPDLVLLDNCLPGECGLDLCRRLRATPAYAALPIALFGQLQRTTDVVAALEAGVDFVLAKDLVCQPDAWDQRLREILTARDDGQAGSLLVSWEESRRVSPLSATAISQINQALRHPSLRLLGPEVMRALMQRALLPARIEWPSWLQSDGLLADAAGVAQIGDSAAMADFCAALARQIYCVVGAAASASFSAALATAFAPQMEEQPHG